MDQTIDLANQVWSTDAERAAWKREAEQIGAELSQQKYDEFLQWCADQTEDYFDFLGIRGDCDL